MRNVVVVSSDLQVEWRKARLRLVRFIRIDESAVRAVVPGGPFA